MGHVCVYVEISFLTVFLHKQWSSSVILLGLKSSGRPSVKIKRFKITRHKHGQRRIDLWKLQQTSFFKNYEIHFVHCKRNLKLCSLCGEAIQRSKEKEHFEENHVEINCVQCGQKTTRSEEGNHLAYECGKRPITCHYCELRLPRERMSEHQEFCGTRTEFCRKCSRYVLVRDFMDYDSACDGGMNDRQHDLPVSLPCEFCGSLIQQDEVDAHQRECQRLEETEGSQIPLVVEDSDGVFREMVRTPDNFTSSDLHDNQFKPKMKTTASLLCLVKSVANCVHLINWWNTRNNISNWERRRSSFWFSFRKERLLTSDLNHFRFSRLHQDQLNNGRGDDPFPFANFTMEGAPYDLIANIFRDLEDRRWTFSIQLVIILPFYNRKFVWGGFRSF